MPGIWPERVGWAAADAACMASLQAPLSARKALAAAVMLDQLCEAAFAGGWEVGRRGADILAFRTEVARACPAMACVMDLARGARGGPWLEVVPRDVEPEALGRLPVAEFMVSLYSPTVPRLALVTAAGAQHDMQVLLQEALGWWRGVLPEDQTG